MKKYIYLSLATILSFNLFANNNLLLKKIPLDNKFLSTENGGEKSAIDAYSDGVGIYTIGLSDKKFSAMNKLVFSHGEEAKKNDLSLKGFVLSNGSDSEKELASLLGDSSSIPSFGIGDSCDDNDSSTTNDKYMDINGTCQGNSIPVISSLSGWGDILELGTIKTFSIDASDTDGGTLSYTYSLINVSNNEAIVTEQNIGNNYSFDLDISNLLFIPGNEYKIVIKASDGYNNTSFETNTLKLTEKSNIVILANGTVTCPSGTPDTTEIIDGIEYYIAKDKADLKAKINSGIQAERICTTFVTDMSSLFKSNTSFNQYVGSWDVSNVLNMQSMFHSATNFNNGASAGVPDATKNLNSWNVSKVTDMKYLFADSRFNQYIGTWNLASVTTIEAMFTRSSFNNGEDLSGPSTKPIEWKNTDNIKSMGNFVSDSPFNQELKFSVKNVTIMGKLFYRAQRFNQDINHWETGNVITMLSMFEEAYVFNNGQDPGLSGNPLKLNTSKVTHMTKMFAEARKFNQPLNSWNVSSVSIMQDMFFKAESFHQNISNWTVTKVTDWTRFSTLSPLTNNYKPLKFR